MTASRLTTLAVAACITSCSFSDRDLPEPLAGPLIPDSDGKPCGITVSQDVVDISFVPPEPTEVTSRDLPATASTNAGLRISLDREDRMPDTVPVELLDLASCEVVARLDATRVRASSDEVGYLVSPGDALAAVRSGNYVVRLADSFTGGIEPLGSVTPIYRLPLQVPQCSGRVVTDEVVHFGKTGGERTFYVREDGASDLCVEIRKASDFWVIRELRVNSQRVYPPSELTDDLPVYVVEYPGHARDYDVKVSLAKGSAQVILKTRERPDPEQRDGIECGGRLEGYMDPVENAERRNIERGTVWVECTAKYQTGRSYKVKSYFGLHNQGRVIASVSAPAVTDESGRFDAWIAPAAIQSAGAAPADALLGVETDCIYDAECGVDRTGTHTVNPDWAWWLPIRNVPDLAYNGLVARLVTTDPPDDHPVFGERGVLRLFSNFGSIFGLSKANDLPVVVHEAFDPLLEDGTEGLVWALGGQPTDYSKPGDAGKVRATACDGEIRGACFRRQNQLFADEPPHPDCIWSTGCPSSEQTGSARFRCEGVNVLKIMLDEGYDVWLVDHARRNPDVLELATRSPVLYQMIADYPSREWFGRKTRKLTVVGLSMGAVVARIAVRLWELAPDLDRLGPESELRIFGSTLLRDSAEDRVALYASYEGPHRGSRLPLAFQALIKDDTMPSRLNFSDLLNSKAAEQLTIPFVNNLGDTSCIVGGEPRDCVLGPEDISGAQQTVFESALLRFQSVEVLDALDDLPPRPVLFEPLPPLSRDGIPKRVPAIAVSNGRLQRGAAAIAGPLADIKVVKKALWIDEFVPDDHVELRSEFDPHGSGLDQICRLKELKGSGREYLIFTGELKVDVFRRPTFVETRSALSLDYASRVIAKFELPFRWHDAIAAGRNLSHFNVAERQCQFLMYHLDGKMRGDRDGYPACNPNATSCASRGTKPGLVIAPNYVPSEASKYCDPNDADADVLPPAVSPSGRQPLPNLPIELDAELERALRE